MGEHLSLEEVLEARQSTVGENVTLAYDEPIYMTSAVGCSMTDHEGNVWLDCINNVAHVGHCEQSVVDAQCEQLRTLNTNARYLSGVQADYTRALTATMPASIRTCFLCNSGSEANDLALQMAFASRPGARHVAVMEGAYHGHVSTMMACSPYKFWGVRGAGRPDWVHVLPLPDSYRGKHLDGAASARAAVCAAERAGARIAAFFCESALSCGGQIILPDGYLQGVYGVMRAHGALCIADEVQCGFGRMGRFFWGFEHQGVEPEMVVTGKAMGNGFPVSAVIAQRPISRAFAQGPQYFNTFGGCNAACASGLAVLKAVQRLNLQRHAIDIGDQLLAGLRSIQQEHPDTIGDVRGLGLFLGVEVVEDGGSRKQSPGKAKWIKEHMKCHRVLLSTDGPYENVLKIKPPMVFSKENVSQLLLCLRKTLSNLDKAEAEALQERIMSKLEVGQRLARDYFECTYPLANS